MCTCVRVYDCEEAPERGNISALRERFGLPCRIGLSMLPLLGLRYSSEIIKQAAKVGGYGKGIQAMIRPGARRGNGYQHRNYLLFTPR